MTLAERQILPDVTPDAQQVPRHLDRTAWTAIAGVEAEIGELACARLAPRTFDSTPGSIQRAVGLALRALEGTLRYGRPSFGARDAAWAIAVRASRDVPLSPDDAPTSPPAASLDGVPGSGPADVSAVYAAVLDAIQQVAPAAEDAARTAADAILDEAAAIAARPAVARPPAAAAPTPIPPLAFRALADLPHVAYVVDRALCYAYVNQAWDEFAQANEGTACLGSAVVGRSWIESMSGPDREHWLAIAEQLLDGALPSHREEIPCHSPRDCRFVVVTASPLRLTADDAEVAGLVFVTYDVTDLRQAESERHWLEQEGRRVRDVFLGTVAHDLRNPLTTIKGRAQLLRRRVERAEMAPSAGLTDSLDAIEATADQMVGQIDELLDVAQVQAGQPIRMHAQPIDLAALIGSVIQSYEQQLGGRRASLDAPARPVVGRWDGVRIRRVVANLISNAIKYSPDEGEIAVTVERVALDGRDWAVFAVQDQGIGIPAADLPSIFSSFYRGSNVDAETGGFGLGLAGAHQIVVQHGGRIEVTSDVGVGTTFTVHLPLDE
ncbi:MAG: ATP-binding protein [Chloroflexota bacterium]